VAGITVVLTSTLSLVLVGVTLSGG